MADNNLLLETLRQSGNRITPQRRAICEFLAATEEHPTAQDIFEALRPQFDSLSLATIYNTVETLTQQGVINILGDIGDGAVHFDADLVPHVNLACFRCRRVTNISSQFVTRMDDEITRASGYRLLGSRVLYYGVCPDCQSAV